MNRNDQYLGDGVYWHFDGFYFWLKTQRLTGMHEIALEPEMVQALHDLMLEKLGEKKGTIG